MHFRDAAVYFVCQPTGKKLEPLGHTYLLGIFSTLFSVEYPPGETEYPHWGMFDNVVDMPRFPYSCLGEVCHLPMFRDDACQPGYACLGQCDREVLLDVIK